VIGYLDPYGSLLPNLVATLYNVPRPTPDVAESMALWLWKPVTIATLLGIIAFTPVHYPSIETDSVVHLQSAKSGSSTPEAPAVGDISGSAPRDLFDIRVVEGAYLLAESTATPAWTSSVRLVDASFDGFIGEDCEELDLGTIFALLQLAGHQCDPDEIRKQDELSKARQPEGQSEYHKYHLRLHMSKHGYDAFAKRVSESILCVYRF
jgi:hypothetical protein